MPHPHKDSWNISFFALLRIFNLIVPPKSAKKIMVVKRELLVRVTLAKMRGIFIVVNLGLEIFLSQFFVPENFQGFPRLAVILNQLKKKRQKSTP